MPFVGRRFYDAGVSESVPYRTALAQGATHLLILRSRHAPNAAANARPAQGAHRPSRSTRAQQTAVNVARRPSRSTRLLARTTLRRETPALRAAFLARESRLAADDQLLAEYQTASRIPPASLDATDPAVFSIRPAPESPVVSRLATDGALLRAALESGRVATHSAFRGSALTP